MFSSEANYGNGRMEIDLSTLKKLSMSRSTIAFPGLFMAAFHRCLFLDAVEDSIMLAMTSQACTATEQWSQLVPKLLQLEKLSHKNLQDVFVGMSSWGEKYEAVFFFVFFFWGVGVGMGIS